MPVKLTYTPAVSDSNGFFGAARKLLKNGTLCDVILTCEDGGKVVGHKAILAAASHHFQAMFATTEPSMMLNDGNTFGALATRSHVHGDSNELVKIVDKQESRRAAYVYYIPHKTRHVKAAVNYIYRKNIILDNQDEDFDTFHAIVHNKFGIAVDRTSFTLLDFDADYLDDGQDEENQPIEEVTKGKKRKVMGPKGKKKAVATSTSPVSIVPQSLQALRSLQNDSTVTMGQQPFNKLLQAQLQLCQIQQQQQQLQAGSMNSGGQSLLPNWNLWHAVANAVNPQNMNKNVGYDGAPEEESEAGQNQAMAMAKFATHQAAAVKDRRGPRTKCTAIGCKKYYRNQNSMLAHVISAHYDMIIVCPRRECTKEFESSQAFISHISCHAEYIEPQAVFQFLKQAEQEAIKYGTGMVVDTAATKKKPATKKVSTPGAVDLSNRPLPTSTTAASAATAMMRAGVATVTSRSTPPRKMTPSNKATPPRTSSRKNTPTSSKLATSSSKCSPTDATEMKSTVEEDLEMTSTSLSEDESSDEGERPKSRSEKVTSSQH